MIVMIVMTEEILSMIMIINHSSHLPIFSNLVNDKNFENFGILLIIMTLIAIEFLLFQ